MGIPLGRDIIPFWKFEKDWKNGFPNSEAHKPFNPLLDIPEAEYPYPTPENVDYIDKDGIRIYFTEEGYPLIDVGEELIIIE
jgi:hypothetical protein